MPKYVETYVVFLFLYLSDRTKPCSINPLIVLLLPTSTSASSTNKMIHSQASNSSPEKLSYSRKKKFNAIEASAVLAWCSAKHVLYCLFLLVDITVCFSTQNKYGFASLYLSEGYKHQKSGEIEDILQQNLTFLQLASTSRFGFYS